MQNLEIQNANKPVSYESCQSIFRNTLELQDKLLSSHKYSSNNDKSLFYSIYVHELFQTQRCDRFHDFSYQRIKMIDTLGGKQNTQDIIDGCGNTLLLYPHDINNIQKELKGNRKELLKSLSFSQHASYRLEYINSFLRNLKKY
jgi:hypothetical protein